MLELGWKLHVGLENVAGSCYYTTLSREQVGDVHRTLSPPLPLAPPRSPKHCFFCDREFAKASNLGCSDNIGEAIVDVVVKFVLHSVLLLPWLQMELCAAVLPSRVLVSNQHYLSARTMLPSLVHPKFPPSVGVLAKELFSFERTSAFSQLLPPSNR